MYASLQYLFFFQQVGEDARPFKSREEKMRHILGYFDWRRFQKGRALHHREVTKCCFEVMAYVAHAAFADQVVCHEGARNDRLWFILEGG